MQLSVARAVGSAPRFARKFPVSVGRPATASAITLTRVPAAATRTRRIRAPKKNTECLQALSATSCSPWRAQSGMHAGSPESPPRGQGRHALADASARAASRRAPPAAATTARYSKLISRLRMLHQGRVGAIQSRAGQLHTQGRVGKHGAAREAQAQFQAGEKICITWAVLGPLPSLAIMPAYPSAFAGRARACREDVQLEPY